MRTPLVRGLSAAGALAVAAFWAGASAQSPRPTALPEDWTHYHQVFSNAGTYVDMLKPGVSQERWERWLGVNRDPRYLLQLRKRDPERAEQVDKEQYTLGFSPTASIGSRIGGPSMKPASGLKPRQSIKRDWSNVRGSAAALSV